MSVYRLKGTAGAVVNQAFPLAGRLLIGRADDCDIRIEEEGVAPHHLEVSTTSDGGVSLTVLDAKGEVLLNGAPVDGASLAGGDEIRVGSCRLMLQAPGLRPDRVLTPDAIAPRKKRWPWLLLAGLGVAAALAWSQGLLDEWVAILSRLGGG